MSEIRICLEQLSYVKFNIFVCHNLLERNIRPRHATTTEIAAVYFVFLTPGKVHFGRKLN